MVEYKLKNGEILKDGHTMFIEDVVRDLNRKAWLEDNRCLLYIDPNNNCEALKQRRLEIADTEARYLREQTP